jgi:hypothetical protein
MLLKRVEDGSRVLLNYYDNYVWGVVQDSRVRYGGELQYTVELERPIQLRWRAEAKTRVLVDHNEIVCCH